MSSLLESLGVDAATAASLDNQAYEFPKIVEGRVAHIDADFCSYQVSAESKAELDPEDDTPRKTLDDMKHNAVEAIEFIRKMAGAEKAVLHTTHTSSKGGRAEAAILKPYQANRAGREKPEHLDTIREFLGQGFPTFTDMQHIEGKMHTDQEADDGMAQAQYRDPENAVVCSKDKDLNMVPGYKLDMDTLKVFHVGDPFGKLWIDTSKKTKKVSGYGTKYFWYQMLAGDSADNISGLPECPGTVWQKAAGTKAYYDLVAQVEACKDQDKRQKLLEKMYKLEAKTKKCGPMLAYAILEHVYDDLEAYGTVKACYELLESEHGYEYKHWETGEPRTATQVMFSEMLLLWMRRNKDPRDVIDWLKGKLNAQASENNGGGES